jgi:hypothetical protein
MLTPKQTLTNSAIRPFRNPDQARKIPVRLPGDVTLAAGTVLGFVTTGAAARNEVQTLTKGGTVSGGTYTITFGSKGTTAAIAYNATATGATSIQSAIDLILGAGNTVVAGGPVNSTPVTITFQNDAGLRDIPLVTVDGTLLTGSTPSITPTESTKGYPGPTLNAAAYNDGNSDGTQTAKAILVRNTKTDYFGRIIDEFGSTDNVTTDAWVSGHFLISDSAGTLLLTGMDANGVTDLGRLVDGTAYTTPGAVIAIA